jgi:hypothetical protein
VNRFALLRRARPEPLARDRAAVLLASPGLAFSDQAVKDALDLAGGELIRVLSVAKIFGTALGLQHPGLLPSKREIKAQEDIVADAIERIERSGGKAKGEIVATRDPGKTFYRAAVRYSVRHAVLVPSAGTRLRRLLEGDPARTVRRRLGEAVEVRVVERQIVST